MQYEFKNGVMMKMSEKLVIAAINPLECYLIIKIDYINLFLVNKLIVLGIEFEVPKGIGFANDSLVKPRKQTKPGQYVLRQSKN